MRTMLLIPAVLAATLALASPAAARTIYVNNAAGDDRLTGAAPQSEPGGQGPVRTITRALWLAEPGDRIVLANTGQPYRESITLAGSRLSGSGAQPLVIDGGGAVLDGSVPVPPTAWENHRGPVFRFRPPQDEFQQLLLGGRPAPRVIADPRSDEPPKLEPGQWCTLRGWIYFCVERTRLPDQYPLSFAYLQTGITLFHAQQVVIQDLIVQHFQLDGINAFNSVRRTSLVRVVARGNGRAGVAVGGASVVSVDQCLIGNNGHAQLLTLPLSEIHVHGGELLSNTAPGWVDSGGKAFFDGKQVEGGLDAFRPAGQTKGP